MDVNELFLDVTTMDNVVSTWNICRHFCRQIFVFYGMIVDERLLHEMALEKMSLDEMTLYSFMSKNGLSPEIFFLK